MPGRSCGSKTRPRSRHRATGTPSGPDQRGERHGSRVHTAHRNGVNPTAARYPAGRRRGRLRATCPQGYAIPDGSAGAPRDDTFCHRARSSSRSKPLGETGMGYCTRYARLTSYTGQLWVDKPDGLFRGQPPRSRSSWRSRPLLHLGAHLIHKAAGGGNHRLRVTAADAQDNMLYPGVFVAFDGVNHLLRRAADGGRTSGGIATIAKGDVVHPGRNRQAGGITAGLGTEPPQGDGFLRQGLGWQIARMPAISKADGTAQGCRGIATNPHRGMWFLHRFWIEAQIGNPVVLAL